MKFRVKMANFSFPLLFAVFSLLLLISQDLVSAGRAPDIAPDLPDGWCDRRYGTPTRSTGECICKQECEGKGCVREQGFVFYSGVSCKDCKCIPVSSSSSSSSSQQEDEGTETMTTTHTISSTKPIRKSVKRVIPRDEGRDEDDVDPNAYDPSTENEEDQSITWMDWYNDISHYIFATILCMIMVPVLIAPAIMSLSNLFNTSTSKSSEKYESLKKVGQEYIDSIAKREGAKKLMSGMVVEIIKESDIEHARSPCLQDKCRVSYYGTLINGEKFDSGTLDFAPNQVIKGWTEAMQLMCEGDKWKLHIPFYLAYGERGMPPRIPECSTLVFDIEIHKIIRSTGGKSKETARKEFEKSVVARKTWEKEQEEKANREQQQQTTTSTQERRDNEKNSREDGASVPDRGVEDNNDEDFVEVRREDSEGGTDDM